MQISVCLERILIGMALMLILFLSTAHAEVAPGSGVGILIYPPRQPELLVWVALGMSLFRDCEGHRSRSKQTCCRPVNEQYTHQRFATASAKAPAAWRYSQ